MPRPKHHKPGKDQKSKETTASATAATATANSTAVDGGKAKNRAARKKAKRSFKQAKATIGIVVTLDLETAIARSKSRVESIAKDCRQRNRKFRDIEFDLDNDRNLCLKGLDTPDDEQLNPAGVMRVTDIFDNPQFFVEGSSSSDVAQGALGDCWFLSAIANVATVPGLIEKICVARDEAVGVYGFIFFRDDSWVDVIIDDQLFVQVPKFESLTPDEQNLYHKDLNLYNSIARKGGKILYFARSETDGETWVPLIEKAYAKLHGNYASMSGGQAMEGIEDLTGGVCHSVPLVDILDSNKLWEDLSKGEHRSILYGCALEGIDNTRSLDTARRVYGLVSGHAYTVLRATEYNGKKFVVVRNPWGTGEWKGRWSDGAGEWTAEWLPALAALDHSFGDDGQFIMEYSDFLRHWTTLDCTRLFDSSWAFSSLWVEVEAFGPIHPWTWGDVSFTITVPENTPAVIVLQQVDDRYFSEISGYLTYDFEFAVFKQGSTEVYASSNNTARWCRSQNCEVDLEGGQYVVHVRVDTFMAKPPNYIETSLGSWSKRAFKRVRARQAEAYSKASNFSAETWEDAMPTTLENIAGYDLTQLEIKVVEDKREAIFKKQAILTQVANVEEEEEGGDNDNDEEEKEEEDAGDNDEEEEEEEDAGDNDDDEGEAEEGEEAEEEGEEKPIEFPGLACAECAECPLVAPRFKCMNISCPDYDLCQDCVGKGIHPSDHQLLRLDSPEEAQLLHPGAGGASLLLGLRVYTLTKSKATVSAQLRHGTTLKRGLSGS